MYMRYISNNTNVAAMNNPSSETNDSLKKEASAVEEKASTLAYKIILSIGCLVTSVGAAIAAVILSAPYSIVMIGISCCAATGFAWFWLDAEDTALKMKHIKNWRNLI